MMHKEKQSHASPATPLAPSTRSHATDCRTIVPPPPLALHSCRVAPLARSRIATRAHRPEAGAALAQAMARSRLRVALSRLPMRTTVPKPAPPLHVLHRTAAATLRCRRPRMAALPCTAPPLHTPTSQARCAPRRGSPLAIGHRDACARSTGHWNGVAPLSAPLARAHEPPASQDAAHRVALCSAALTSTHACTSQAGSSKPPLENRVEENLIPPLTRNA